MRVYEGEAIPHEDETEAEGKRKLLHPNLPTPRHPGYNSAAAANANATASFHAKAIRS